MKLADEVCIDFCFNDAMRCLWKINDDSVDLDRHAVHIPAFD